MQLDYLGHLQRESSHFHAALALADPSARVPTCPDWDSADLLWHLTEVQWFWATVVERRLQDPEGLEGPERPPSYADLLDLGAEQSDRLVRALTEADPAEQVYMWAPDKSVGYIRRRQAHEAMIHRIDAELVSGGTAGPLDAALAEDGVDEALRVMFGGASPWGTFTPNGLTALVEAADGGGSWSLELGRFTGTDPETGAACDESDLRVRDGLSSLGDRSARLRGSAAALDAWLWHRAGDEALTFDGDPGALAALRAVLAQPID